MIYIAIGNAMSWGKGETKRQALARMRKGAYCGHKTTAWRLWETGPDSDAYVDDMGTLNWKTGTHCKLIEVLADGKRQKID